MIPQSSPSSFNYKKRKNHQIPSIQSGKESNSRKLRLEKKEEERANFRDSSHSFTNYNNKNHQTPAIRSRKTEQ